MSDPRDYKLDIAGLTPSPESSGAVNARPYLSAHFKCCGVYARIYRSVDGKRYNGHCPKCANPVHFQVGDGGTDCRFFVIE